MGETLTVEAIARAAGRISGAAVRFWPDLTDDRGRPRAMRRVTASIAGRCSSPRTVVLWSKQSERIGKIVKPMALELKVRCRDCGWCRNQRKYLWADRAVREYEQSARTWFATLTVSPEEHFKALTRARLSQPGVDGTAKAGWKPTDFESTTVQSQFCALVREHGTELTKFVKRVRKNSGSRIRYLMVAEKHESGLPHFHMLIHEVNALEPVRKAVLKDAWRIGFSKFTLVNDARAATYCCKYLAKSALTRVRASAKYGTHVVTHDQKF